MPLDPPHVNWRKAGNCVMIYPPKLGEFPPFAISLHLLQVPMARKVVNRKALREEAEAAEQAEAAAPKKKKKKAAKRKSRAKQTEVRRKLFWGVFSQSLKRVALYEYSQKKQAEKKAEDLSKSGKSPHFVQKVKEEIEE